MAAYKDDQRGTWFAKFCYKDWQGEKKWITKRGFATKREAVQYERDFLMRKSGDTDMTFALTGFFWHTTRYSDFRLVRYPIPILPLFQTTISTRFSSVCCNHCRTP